jgi:hypothetical protein
MQDIKDSRLGPDIGIAVNPQGAGDFVSRFEADPKNVGRETVRVLLDDLDGFWPYCL